MESSYRFSNASESGAAATPALASVLETFIPGLSIFTKFTSDYFGIDVTRYLWGILVLVAVSTAFNYCSEKVQGVWNYFFLSTAEIQYNDEIYNYIMFWVSKHCMSKTAAHFIAGTQTNSAFVYTEEEDDETVSFDDDDLLDSVTNPTRNWDRMKTLRYTPSQGTHYFRYKGRLITFTRTKEKEQGYFGSQSTETLYLSCFWRNPQLLKDLIREAQTAYMERDGNKTVIYRGTKPIGGAAEDMEWIRCMSRPPRPLSTVVLDEGEKKMVLEDMQDYLHPRTKRWYSNRGIPYRRGYLMEGSPGTGKSSLVFSLAGALQLRLYMVSLNSRSITEDSLASLFRDLPWRCIVLLEDVDAAGLAAKRVEGRKPEKTNEDDAPSEKPPGEEKISDNGSNPPPLPIEDAVVNRALSLSGFLNIIDGVASSEGRILIMTTNHMERLDPALLRPGRIDRVVRFGLADSSMIKGIFKAIYATFESERPSKTSTANKNSDSGINHRTVGYLHHEKTDEEIAELAETFANLLPSNEFSPAEIQNYLLRHKMTPETAIEGASDWITETRENKKRM